jgi:3-oxoacid CoA-transferase
MWARTRSSSARCWRANSNSNSSRRARWPSVCAPAARAFPGFYTRTAFGTKLAEGKETKLFDGKDYVLEPGIKADVSLVKAWKGDKSGNLVFRKTARNFNPMIATCGKVCIAEVEQLVEVGELAPDDIHTPGIYVDRIIQG